MTPSNPQSVHSMVASHENGTRRMRNGARVVVLIAAFLLIAFSASPVADALYLPGMRPNTYDDQDQIEVLVNVLTSVKTHLPFDYYKNVPSCPKPSEKKNRGNIGGVLLGDRIDPAPYGALPARKNIGCAVVCPSINIEATQKKFLSKAILQDYQFNYLLDGLPLAQLDKSGDAYTVGIPVGTRDPSEALYLHNHLHFVLRYTEVNDSDTSKVKNADSDISEKPHYTIVAFLARPLSVNFKSAAECQVDTKLDDLEHSEKLNLGTSSTVMWTYSVEWVRSENSWASRWDFYMNTHSANAHWYSIVNSTFTVFFLSAVVALIMMRTLRKDFSKYNAIDLDLDEVEEETGWKLLHRDVFRPPPCNWLLAALVGAGVQLVSMSMSVLLFAVLGFFSPQNRGRLFTTLLIFFAFLGLLAGFTSSRLLKLWGKVEWVYILLTGVIVPGVAFSVFFVINFIVWLQSSSAAVPFGAMMAIVMMWLFVCVPLVFLGAIFGFKRAPISLPVSVSVIPRHIPKQPWYNRAIVTFATGVLPFGAVLIEVYYVLDAMWLNRFYYVFGFLFLVLVILVIITAEVTIVTTYFSLCAENYNWWWRSFASGGSVGIYLFGYSMFYVATGNLHLQSFVPLLLYTGYMALISFLFSVTAGTVGFLASFWFIRYIYSSIKLD